MSQKTKLHYIELLTLADGRKLTDTMAGIYKAANAFAGPGVSTMALGYLSRPLKEHIRKTFPWTADPSIKDAIDAAVAEWQAAGGGQEGVRGDEDLSLQPFLDKHVLPLCPSAVIEVEHLGDEECNRLGDGYDVYLRENFNPENVLVVVTPEEGKA